MTAAKAVCAVLLVGFATAIGAVDTTQLADPALQERYRALTHELRCMQCQNQSIADSPVGLAGDLRRQVKELLEQGKTDADVRQYMSDRYGAFILFRPEFNARTAWLWVAPFVLLLIGAVVAFRIMRQRRDLLPQDTSDVDTDAVTGQRSSEQNRSS
jgi:cytochrome c-type biogenesis protein CcmH